MDFRVDKLSRIRSLPRPEDGIRAVAQHAPDAEALAARVIERTRPYWTWVYLSRRRLATTSVVLLTLWLFVHVTFGANGMVVYRQKRAEMLQLRKENEQLQRENDAYGQNINALRNDKNAIEKEARQKLGYVRPGEVVYVAPTAPAPPPRPAEGSARK
jgi:cell division protein FtsB